MNERIKELLIESGYPNFYAIVDGEELEKFAELIVKECADLVQGVPTDTMGYHSADQKIKQHFGVK